MESHFILKLSPKLTELVNNAIDNSQLDLLRIYKSDEFFRVVIGEMEYEAVYYDLPNIIEAHKSLDHRQFYKSTDISNCLHVFDEGKPFDRTIFEKQTCLRNRVTFSEEVKISPISSFSSDENDQPSENKTVADSKLSYDFTKISISKTKKRESQSSENKKNTSSSSKNKKLSKKPQRSIKKFVKGVSHDSNSSSDRICNKYKFLLKIDNFHSILFSEHEISQISKQNRHLNENSRNHHKSWNKTNLDKFAMENEESMDSLQNIDFSERFHSDSEKTESFLESKITKKEFYDVTQINENNDTTHTKIIFKVKLDESKKQKRDIKHIISQNMSLLDSQSVQNEHILQDSNQNNSIEISTHKFTELSKYAENRRDSIIYHETSFVKEKGDNSTSSERNKQLIHSFEELKPVSGRPTLKTDQSVNISFNYSENLNSVKNMNASNSNKPQNEPFVHFSTHKPTSMFPNHGPIIPEHLFQTNHFLSYQLENQNTSSELSVKIDTKQQNGLQNNMFMSNSSFFTNSSSNRSTLPDLSNSSDKFNLSLSMQNNINENSHIAKNNFSSLDLFPGKINKPTNTHDEITVQSIIKSESEIQNHKKPNLSYEEIKHSLEQSGLSPCFKYSKPLYFMQKTNIVKEQEIIDNAVQELLRKEKQADYTEIIYLNENHLEVDHKASNLSESDFKRIQELEEQSIALKAKIEDKKIQLLSTTNPIVERRFRESLQCLENEYREILNEIENISN